MALTSFQSRVCRVLADQRKRSGESYVAGGVALNELLGGARRSHASTWPRDRDALVAAGLVVETLRELPAFVEVRVRGGDDDVVLVQWAQDSAYRSSHSSSTRSSA